MPVLAAEMSFPVLQASRVPLNPNSLQLDEIMEPRSVSDCVCCLRARLVAPFSVDSNEVLDVKTNDFFCGARGIYIGRSDTPAVWDHS